MAEIVYPQGCRPITDDLGPDELVRRLKVCFGIYDEMNLIVSLTHLLSRPRSSRHAEVLSWCKDMSIGVRYLPIVAQDAPDV